MRPIIKGLGVVGICLLFFSTAFSAETRYVNDKMKITMRTAPGVDRKIISLLSIGQKVELIETGDEWTRIRLANAKEGWVLSRFLTDKVPSKIELEKLKSEHKALVAQVSSLLEENKVLKTENNSFRTELTSNKNRLQNLDKAYNALKTESADFLDLQSKYKKTAVKLAEQTKKADQYEEDLTKILWNQNIKWFLSGAGVLILGFIIGFSTKRQRRHSSLL